MEMREEMKSTRMSKLMVKYKRILTVQKITSLGFKSMQDYNG